MTSDDTFIPLRSVTFTYGIEDGGEPTMRCDWNGSENVVIDAGMKSLIKGYIAADEEQLMDTFIEGLEDH